MLSHGLLASDVVLTLGQVIVLVKLYRLVRALELHHNM